MAYERGERDAVGRTITGLVVSQDGAKYFVLDDGHALVATAAFIATPAQVDAIVEGARERLRQAKADLEDLEKSHPPKVPKVR